jgi:hypothetical protein
MELAILVMVIISLVAFMGADPKKDSGVTCLFIALPAFGSALTLLYLHAFFTLTAVV